MTMPDSGPEMPLEMPESAMTFDKLHAGFEELGLDQCDCTKLDGVTDDQGFSYTRLMRLETGDETVSEIDFESHYEIPISLNREPRTCKDHCQSRGVSINRLNGTNLPGIKERYRSIAAHSQWFGKRFCTFRLSNNAGKIWNDKPTNPVQHCNLLKCDKFCKDSIIILKIEKLD